MPRKNVTNNAPLGFKLRHIFKGHKAVINQISWSPDGRMFASLPNDLTIWLWDAVTGELSRKLKGSLVDKVAWSPGGRTLATGGITGLFLWNIDTGEQYQKMTTYVKSVEWSPDGQLLAVGLEDGDIWIWNIRVGRSLQTLLGHSGSVNSVAWSPDGQTLASGANDSVIRLWDAETGRLLHKFQGHSNSISKLNWSPNGRMLASSSRDHTIRLWDTRTGQQRISLEGHVAEVASISFSADGLLLASQSRDGTVRLWRTDTWEVSTILEKSLVDYYSSAGVAFHPTTPSLITLDGTGTVIYLWDLDLPTILGSTPSIHSVHYANAKAVLVGDTGVGKSGLGLVLTGLPFIPTESTHGRRIWTFDNQEIEFNEGRKETRETLLWDLAGQPGYRLIHQLHLNEVAVALVVFDSHSETDPFAGVYHWVRALQLAQRVQGSSALPMKKYLVAARADRGGVSVSQSRINSLVNELELDGYIETSAKEGWCIKLLNETIRKAIDWEILPRVSSTDLFQRIKRFLISEKEARRLLSTVEDLYRAFLQTEKPSTQSTELYAQFETCIGRVESRGLIRKLSFGNLVLLQPELLDAYASALINAVKGEPDGLGSIVEERVREGHFPIPKDERLGNKDLEKLLLIAMVEDLLRHEIALRESSDDGPYLVFPSQSTRENPDLPDPEGRSVIFSFEGPVLNIYATLAVRLSHSGIFEKQDLWKNAITYTVRSGGICGIFLRNIGEGRGELTLFFEKVSKDMKSVFEAYIYAHLQRRALPESISRRRIFICSRCSTSFTDMQVTRRRELGFDWIQCNVCETKVSLFDQAEVLAVASQSRVPEMDRVADNRRERDVSTSILQGRMKVGDFDVFLCYNNEDKSEVKEIGERLKEQGILPWLDEWELQPGLPWQRLLEQQMGQIKSAAVFIGKKGIGPWQQMELEAFLREFVNRGCPVIPIVLKTAPKKPQLPVFLKNMTWVDCRKNTPDPIERLIWGITGKKNL